MNSFNELIDIRWAFFEVAWCLLLICNASTTFYSFSYFEKRPKNTHTNTSETILRQKTILMKELT